MSESQLPPAKPYHPATFMERGVAVPFTTPLLAGTRARQKNTDMELVIPNPSGGRGVYIVPWTGLKSFCNATLHDRAFTDRIAILDCVTPASVRRVGRDLAAEGLAGEEAMKAARVVMKADISERTLTNYRLLMALVDQAPAALVANHGTNPADASAKVLASVASISARLDRSTNWTASALEAIADVVADIGVDDSASIGRMPRLIAELHTVRAEMAAWGKAQNEDRLTSFVDMVCSVADFTLSLAEAAVVMVRSLIASMLDLLRSWAADPRSVTQLAGRPDWLLDGWEQICLVWGNASDDHERRSALAEIVGLIPILPEEVTSWGGKSVMLDDVLQCRRVVFLDEDWRTGMMVFRLIARNEHFRALAC